MPVLSFSTMKDKLEIILNGTYGTYDLAELSEEQAEELLKEFKSRDLTEWWSKLKNQ